MYEQLGTNGHCFFELGIRQRGLSQVFGFGDPRRPSAWRHERVVTFD